MRKISRAFVIGVGEVGVSVLSGMRDRFLRLSKGSGVPIISLITVESATAKDNRVPGEGTTDPQPISRFFIPHNTLDESEVMPASLDRQRAGSEAQESSSAESISDKTRMYHALKFVANAPLLAQFLRDMVLRIVDAQTASELNVMGMEMRSDAHLDILIIGDLGDPFASSMIIDLPYLVRHVVELELVDERVSKNYMGMWFLPTLPLPSHEALDMDERRKMEQWRAAITYAALKELDFFMDQASYEKRFDLGLKIRAKGMAPYDYVYLIDSVNESSQRVPSLSQMTEMVAEWIYLNLTTKMGEEIGKHVVQVGNIRSYGKLAAYSGLGLAIYMLPIEELIEVEALRLGIDMLGEERGILHEPPQNVEAGIFFNVNKESIEGDLRYKEEDCNRMIEECLRDTSHALRNIAPYDLDTFLGRIDRIFGYRYTDYLRNIESCLSSNLRVLLEDKEKEIRERALRKIDEVHKGGISLALRGVRSLTHTVEEQLEATRVALQTSERNLNTASKKLRAAQAAHIASVFAFYPKALPQRIVTWLWLGLFVALSSWLSITSFLFAKDNLVGIVSEWRGEEISLIYRVILQVATFLFLSAFIVAITASVVTAIQWWNRTRKNYISSHTIRITEALNKIIAEMTLHFFDGIKDSIRRITVDIVDLRDKVEEVRDILQQRLNEPHPLYGSPRLIVEESLLQEEDIDDLYQEIVGDSVENEIRDFTQDDRYGLITKWMEIEPDRIARMIIDFGRRYMGRLRVETDAETFLEKHAISAHEPHLPRIALLETSDGNTGEEILRAVQRKIRKLIDTSKPFLRYRRTAIESTTTPALVQVVGFYRAGEEKSVIGKAIEQIRVGYGSTIVTSQLPDRHRIISISARHGLPLSAIGMLSIYREQYHRLKLKERGLHQNAEYLMLPDLFPIRHEGEAVLDPREAIALGLAFKKVRWNSKKKAYEFTYIEEDLEKKVTVALGQDKVMAVVYLQEHVNLLAILSKQILTAMKVMAEVEREGKDGETIKDSDPRLVSEFLDNYLRRGQRRRKLEDWEILAIKNHIRL